MALFSFQSHDIYYVDLGQGRPILFLHGITNSGRAWLDQITFFVGQGYRVIVPDLPGHGSSSPTAAPISPADYARAVIALLRHLDIDTATCCGVSLGGAVTIEAALAAPELFDRLVISNSFLNSNTEAQAQMAESWKELFRRPHGPTLRLEATWPILVSAAYRESDAGIRTYLVNHAQSLHADGESYCNATDGMRAYDTSDRAGTIRQPTLVLSGANDRIAPVAASEAIKAAIPGSRHVTFAGSEHLSNLDSADMFNRTVLEFLSE